jgi:hypothetical protein
MQGRGTQVTEVETSKLHWCSRQISLQLLMPPILTRQSSSARPAASWRRWNADQPTIVRQQGLTQLPRRRYGPDIPTKPEEGPARAEAYQVPLIYVQSLGDRNGRAAGQLE